MQNFIVPMSKLFFLMNILSIDKQSLPASGIACNVLNGVISDIASKGRKKGGNNVKVLSEFLRHVKRTIEFEWVKKGWKKSGNRLVP